MEPFEVRGALEKIKLIADTREQTQRRSDKGLRQLVSRLNAASSTSATTPRRRL
jgi:hypothetical protein